ncbi:hypothetical protein FQZ97_952750 [compost metagenome]
MAVAQPTMKMIAPESEAVSISIGFRRFQSNCRYTKRPISAEYTMPMVDTSVAVATPSTTAARITKGSSTAGSATISSLLISRLL